MTRITQIAGIPVLDAKRPITLKVTRRDIAAAAASTKNPATCAVARACHRDLHVLEARIHLGRCYLRTDNDSWVRYKTPSIMRDEIIAFDRGGTFEPGEFTLYPVEQYNSLGTPARGHTRTKTGKKRHKPTFLRNVRGGPATSK